MVLPQTKSDKHLVVGMLRPKSRSFFFSSTDRKLYQKRERVSEWVGGSVSKQADGASIELRNSLLSELHVGKRLKSCQFVPFFALW